MEVISNLKLQEPQVSPLSELRICQRCVMDESDPEIEFDTEGVCNHCHAYEQVFSKRVIPEAEIESRILTLVSDIKRAGQNREYDCVIGLSGGVDSSYVALKAKQLGLRPLAVHFDNGWNAELAVGNIERLVKKLDLDLYTYVVEWEEFKDIQMSLLKASLPSAEIPTDHAIFAVLMKVALKYRVPYIVTGTNVRTEGIYIESWGYGHSDWRHIKDVHRRHGNLPIKTFPYFSLSYLAYVTMVRRVRFASILNYLRYDKFQAIDELVAEVGWTPYEGKHHESVYTRFFQSYILPVKFGIDKRKSHLSALIYSDPEKFTRDWALEELQKPICPPSLVREDKEYVAKKFSLSVEQFDQIMAVPPRSFKTYKSNYNLIKSLRKFQAKLRQIGLMPN